MAIAQFSIVAFDCPDPQALAAFHIDFDVDDLETAEREVLALGAVKAEVQPGDRFTVFLDPVGHPFCLVLRD